MVRQRSNTSRRGCLGRLAWLPFAVILCLLISSPVRGQETPEPTPEGTPDAVARIRIVAPEESIDVGEEFEVQVLVEDVEHVGAFDFAVAFDPELLRFEGMQDVGTFLSSGEREFICTDPTVSQGAVLVSCATTEPPVCLGGSSGAAGSGLLARAAFTVLGDGTTTLELRDPTHLLLDDVEPCDPSEGRIVEIPHRRENATVQLGSGGGFPWLIVGPIIGVAALILVGGVGFLQYRRRGVSSTP